MTERLYYTDSTLRAFDAVVLSSDVVDGRPHVVLDRTAFYPTSGGQPFDTGRLGDATVIDVFDTDDDRVVHVVTAPLATGTSVHGDIDWARRLDHMQQHTGQHILSAAFDRLFGVRTTSFHLGSEASTIDLAREVSAAEFDAAERAANDVVWDDRPVDVRFVTAEEASALPLRKDPARTGTLRLVEVPDFDLSACGGTHVPRTGVVGIIASAGVERFKGGCRVTFVCGRRALDSHRRLRDVVLGATRALSVTPGEIVAAIEKSHVEAKEIGRLIRRIQEDNARYRGTELQAAAETIGPCRGVLRPEPELDAPALKALASAITAGAGLVAVLTGRGTPVPVVIARSADVALDASALIRAATAALGGRGGGSASLAQGGVTAAPEAIIDFVRCEILNAV